MLASNYIDKNIKAKVDLYVKWLNRSKFLSKQNEMCWLDIDNEIYQILQNFKIKIIATVEQCRTTHGSEITNLLARSNIGKDKWQSDHWEVVQEEIDKLKLVESYTRQYLDMKTERSNHTYYVYKPNIGSIGFRALYYFSESDWWKCKDEQDFIEVFDRCVRNDFGTAEETRELVKEYKTTVSDKINELLSSIKELHKNLKYDTYGIQEDDTEYDDDKYSDDEDDYEDEDDDDDDD